MGRFIGAAAFGAMGVAGTIMNLFLFIISGFCTGISIILAQFYGCKDWNQFRREYFTALLSGLLFTITLSILGLIALNPVLNAIGTPAEVAGYAGSYLTIIFSGLWALFFYHFLSAFLRAMGDTKAALVFLALSVAVNLFLDLAFVGHLGMGIGGAAWATLLSQLLSVFLCVIYIRKKAPGLTPGRQDMHMDPVLLRRTWSYCAVTAMHQSNVYIGKLLVQGAVNPLGTDTIAAYTAAGRIEGFANAFGDSGCAAISVFAAQNHGAGHKKRARAGFLTGVGMLMALGLLSSLIMYIAADPAAALLLGGGSGVLKQCCEYLKLISIFYVFCFIGNAQVGYFEGHGQMMVPVIGATSHITLRVILSFLLTPRAGLAAVALATGAGWILAVSFWQVIYLIGRKNTSHC